MPRPQWTTINSVSINIDGIPQLIMAWWTQPNNSISAFEAIAAGLPVDLEAAGEFLPVSTTPEPTTIPPTGDEI